MSGSRIETFGMAVYEALASGIRVAAGPALGGLATLSQAPGVRVTSRDADPHALADAVEAVLAVDRPGLLAHEWVKQYCSPSAVANKLAPVYASATNVSL